AGLLALDDPCVTRQVAGALERDAQLRVGVDQRAGDSVADGARLAARTAALHAYAHVEGTLDAGDLQRRQCQLAMRGARKVLLDRAAVEPGRPVPRLEDHARDRRLALAGAAVLGEIAHEFSSSSDGAWAPCGCSGPA